VQGGDPQLRVAVAGCGGLARRYHLPALNRMPGVRVVAVADPDASARGHAARVTGATPYADPLHAIVRADVDAVVVCAPAELHADLAIAALEAGRHLYLEKPIATAGADGRRVAAAAARAGTVTAIGLAYRFDPLYGRARALLGEGVVGRLREVSTAYHEPGRPGRGGALIDLGVHHLDLLTWLTGESLAAFEHSELSHEQARLYAELSGGAQVEATFGYGGTRRCGWVFAGDDGWLAVDRCLRRMTLTRDGIDLPAPRRGDGMRTLIRSLPGNRRELVHDRALSAWVERAAGHHRTDLPTPDDGLRALAAVESIESVSHNTLPG
jgi:myo-inositol 2-dehydrogenase / D-chiro-inositol 1-dehydrogenase